MFFFEGKRNTRMVTNLATSDQWDDHPRVIVAGAGAY